MPTGWKRKEKTTDKSQQSKANKSFNQKQKDDAVATRRRKASAWRKRKATADSDNQSKPNKDGIKSKSRNNDSSKSTYKKNTSTHQKNHSNSYSQKTKKDKYKSQTNNANAQSTAKPAITSVPDTRSDEEILGVTAPFTLAELKAAKKRLSSVFHDTKFLHMPEDFRKQAEEELKKINVAFDRLKTKAN